MRRAAGARGRRCCGARSRSCADYLTDAAAEPGEVDFGDLGLQLTRASRALKVWLSISHFGVDAFRAAIDRSLDLAELARRRIAEDPRLESVADGELGITCFRRRVDAGEPEAAAVNAALVAAYERAGAASCRPRGCAGATRSGCAR